MRSLNTKAALIIGCLIVALAVLAPPLIRGDEWNLATKFEINHPFEVPGMVLQPNTRYTIKLLDSPSNRNVVQIYNEDQTQMLTMFMAISDERQEPTDRTQFTFIEMQPQAPLPIKEWFYPGRLTGLEFVYPKDQAMKIAAHAREAVLSAESNDLHDLASVKVESIGPLGERAAVTESAANITTTETKSEETAVFEEKPTTTEEHVTAPEVTENAPVVEQTPQVDQEQKVEIAQNTEPAAPVKSEPEVQQEKPSETPSATDESGELPRTAGELPLVALIGVLCLGAGLGLKVLSARS